MFITLWKLYLFARFSFTFITADEIPTVQDQQHAKCFSTGAVAGLVFGCSMGAVLVTVLVGLVVWYYIRKKKETSAETRQSTLKNVSFLAYDNTQFKSDEPLDTIRPVSTLVTVNEQQADTKSSVPVATCIDTKEVGNILRVPLRNARYSGLGFTIVGNLRNGIFVKNVTEDVRQLSSGDRILNVKINFENITYEDAMTILNFASGYPIVLEVEKIKTTCENDESNNFIPLFKSLSIDDTSSIGLDRFLNLPSTPFNLETSTSVNKTIQYTEDELKTSESNNHDSDTNIKDDDYLGNTKPPLKFINDFLQESNKIFVSTCPNSPPLTNGQCLVLEKVSVDNLLEEHENDWKTNISIDTCDSHELSRPQLFRSRSEEHLNECLYNGNCEANTISYSMTNISNPFYEHESVDSFHAKRDSGYGTMIEQQTDDVAEIEKEQFEKLLYFQSQLAKQHEELARLGINVPMPMVLPIKQNF